MSNKPYHVALSYAGEQREYVAKVAKFLKSRNVRCFYDKDEEINLWGKNILESLQNVFEGPQTYFVVIFLSQEYVNKTFPKTELEYALSQAINRKQEYILPARFDSSEIPGFSKLRKYIELNDKSPKTFADMIIEKITEMGIYLGRNTIIEPIESRRIPKENDSKEKGSEVTFMVTDESGSLISGAYIYLIHKNGTHRGKKSNEIGKATFSLNQNGNVFHTVFIAHDQFPAVIIDNFQCDMNCEVTLKRHASIGSMIFDQGVGYIPGIKGRLNPMLDDLDRTYLYADNISINNSPAQSAFFQFGENISLVDCLGKAADIKIHRIIQHCIILDYITH